MITVNPAAVLQVPSECLPEEVIPQVMSTELSNQKHHLNMHGKKLGREVYLTDLMCFAKALGELPTDSWVILSAVNSINPGDVDE